MASSLEGKETTTWDILMSLKAVTFTTGVLHEVQIDQLRLWGQLALGHAGEFKCKVDTEEKTISYGLVTKKKTLTDKKHSFKWLAKAVALLDQSIHQVLGDDWKLSIIHNKKVAYEGKRLKSTEEKLDERRKYRAKRTRK